MIRDLKANGVTSLNRSSRYLAKFAVARSQSRFLQMA
jgi:hypothetical protein